ncbi:transmembrane amino acid transporter protein-domain-containing protein [Microdochium bolleyi]|uniref:Transmembrane amino acid transporter protein-domain-containing protein n=1 Tax=Microdochium bolleyi TaxID=196109 RepID=A0A136JIH2_9PEZI|nr:transmembrane amino acid transporter protein-domain-containing protein [Microdochium bolleyi]
MAKAKTSKQGRSSTTHGGHRGTPGATSRTPTNEEEHGLLAGGSISDDDDDDDSHDNTSAIIVRPGHSDNSSSDTLASADDNSRLGSTGGGPRTPRTPNRVRFDLHTTDIPSTTTAGGTANGPAAGAGNGRRGNSLHAPGGYFDVMEPDSLGRLSTDSRGSDGSGAGGSRYPLLTDIVAPSVALANSAFLSAEDADDWADEERLRPKSGLREAFMNMANSIIGAGIIGQPYAMRQAGMVSGIALLIGLTFVVDWTIRLIVINSKLSGAHSFQGTVEHCFGRTGLVAISAAQWVFAFGGMVAFCVIVGDSIPQVFRAIWPGLHEMPVFWLLGNRQFVIALFVLGVSYPLTLYRDITKLAKASTMALISMTVIVLTVVIQSAFAPAESRGSFNTPLLTLNTGFMQAVGVISFAFVCHHNSLLIYGSLETPTIDRFSRVTHYSMGVSTLACITMALVGFLTFGDKTKGNVLNNFPADNTMVTIARLCFGFNMLTTLPLEAFVCREVMLNYYFPGEPFNMNLHLILSSSLVVSAMGISLLTCDVGAVFDLVGATSACALAYILPPLCYIKLSTPSWRTWMAWAVVAFGSTVMVVSMFQSIGKMIKGGDENSICV